MAMYLGDKEIGAVVESIDLSQTTATPNDVLEGKEFYDASGEKVAGTYKDMLQERVDLLGCDYLFYGLSGDFGFASNLDTSNVTQARGMFGSNTARRLDLSNFDLGKAVNLTDLLEGCLGLTEVILPEIRGGDSTVLKNISSMFSNCQKLESIDWSKFMGVRVYDMATMFYGCYALKSVDLSGLIVDSAIKNSALSGLFRGCGGLTSIRLPNMQASTLSSLNSMFYDCSALTEIDLTPINTSAITSFESAFRGCTRLTTITGELDLYSATTVNYMFSNCTNITNLTLKNIRKTLTIGSGASYGHLLTLDSLLNAIQELWTKTGTTTLKLTMGTTNTAKLANVYVKLIPITDEMREQDQYIDNKAPFVVCESTDEGAMLVTEYVTTVKGWQLA